MKKILLTALLACSITLMAQTLHAQQATPIENQNFGIGAAIGGPDGLSYKAWVSPNSALAGLVSFGITDSNSRFYTHLDYLVHKFYDELDWEVGRLHYYYGGGVGLEWFSQDFIDEEVMIRLPAGFGFQFADVPADLFFELAPTFSVTPDFGFGFNGNVGFRFYLN